MMRWLLVGLAASVALTALLWWLTGSFLGFFLFLPFLFVRRKGVPCPACGTTYGGDTRFCPRDGTPLQSSAEPQ